MIVLIICVKVGKSTYAAKLAISQVVLSRIAMAASTMGTVEITNDYRSINLFQ